MHRIDDKLWAEICRFRRFPSAFREQLGNLIERERRWADERPVGRWVEAKRELIKLHKLVEALEAGIADMSAEAYQAIFHQSDDLEQIAEEFPPGMARTGWKAPSHSGIPAAGN